jgi:hypothetical protein
MGKPPPQYHSGRFALLAGAALIALGIWSHPLAAAPEDEVRATFDRFAALYHGTWRLDPEPGGLKVMMLGDSVAQIYVPILFTIGPSGQAVRPPRFL